MTAIIHPPGWRLQPFEEKLATAEVHSLVGSCDRRDDGAIVVTQALTNDATRQLVNRLSFASRIENERESLTTQQADLESAAGGGSRKVTSHALHGLHPYKGKFYPQLARALMNVCEVPDGGLVLDPFAGCGTTVIEASLLGIRGLGVDANPLAVLVAQTKLRLLWADPDRVRSGLGQIAHAATAKSEVIDLSDEYLIDWFPPVNYSYLRSAVAAIESHPDEVVQDAARVALSSVLRRASWQDPRQLRVGRRKDGGSIEGLEQLFEGAIVDLMAQLQSLQSVEGLNRRRVQRMRSRVVLGDSRDIRGAIRRFARRPIDAVITSPPYANALPYIDTDRLSLRAFGLMPEKSQRLAEANLIGNREITDRNRRLLEDAMRRDLDTSASWIPGVLRSVLTATLQVAQEPTSGFRKQRTPALLYKYFLDMHQVGGQLADLVRPGGRLALVVGDNNVSGPEESTITVPTGDILAELLAQDGFTPTADLSKRLTSFGASSTVHQRNAMADERVLVFER